MSRTGLRQNDGMEKHIQGFWKWLYNCENMWSALVEQMKITTHFTPFTSIKWPESLLETVDVVDQNVTMKR